MVSLEAEKRQVHPSRDPGCAENAMLGDSMGNWGEKRLSRLDLEEIW